MTESFEGSARNFSWKATAREGILTVHVDGELDLAVASDPGKELARLAEREERVVIVDLHAVTFMDSSGLRFLVEMRNAADARGGRLLLGRSSAPVTRVIEIAGLSEWFEYVEGTAP